MAAHYTMVWGVARYDKYLSNTVNSLIATTSRKRPPRKATKGIVVIPVYLTLLIANCNPERLFFEQIK